MWCLTSYLGYSRVEPISNCNKKCGAHLSNCDGCVLSGLVKSLTLYQANGVVKSQRVIC